MQVEVLYENGSTFRGVNAFRDVLVQNTFFPKNIKNLFICGVSLPCQELY